MSGKKPTKADLEAEARALRARVAELEEKLRIDPGSPAHPSTMIGRAGTRQ